MNYLPFQNGHLAFPLPKKINPFKPNNIPFTNEYQNGAYCEKRFSF